ncbi:MAG: hypothetical protein KC657_29550 [Myxococcales bacterium]|nr:hypothetical protein [Myxococcales bacterium]
MKNIWMLAALAATAGACSSETIIVRQGAGESEEESATPPATDAGVEAAAPSLAPDASFDPCACPSHCRAPDGKAVCNPAAAPAEVSDRETIGDYIVSSYEYWPWKETDPIEPSKVHWGYDSGSGAARACIAEARKVLVDILKNGVPPELEKLREMHGVRAFYQMNHDMTGAADARKVPADREGLWLYDSRLVKWVSHTERDGKCRLPNRSDLVAFARACQTTFPRCGSGR